jgi:hypothetical protein
MNRLFLSLFVVLFLAAISLATPVAKNVFRPENIGMGYRGRKSTAPRQRLPFPGKLGVVLGPENAEARVDRVDKVDCVDKIDGVCT